MIPVEINTEYITLDQFIKFINIVSSGGEAKLLIKNGLVSVNKQEELRRGRKLYPGDIVEIEGLGIWSVTRTGE